jgi:hypothetical protein
MEVVGGWMLKLFYGLLTAIKNVFYFVYKIVRTNIFDILSLGQLGEGPKFEFPMFSVVGW